MKFQKQYYETRYYAGIELSGGFNVENGPGEPIGGLWKRFEQNELPNIPNIIKGTSMIGLEIYPPDFNEVQQFDYYAMAEISELTTYPPHIVTKKLPAGEYIRFEISFDKIQSEIPKVYNYVKEEQIPVHFGFDYEEYLPTQNYMEKGATLYFVLKLEND